MLEGMMQALQQYVNYYQLSSDNRNSDKKIMAWRENDDKNNNQAGKTGWRP